MKNISSLLTKLTLRLWPLFLVGTVLLSVVSLPRTVHLFKNISTDPIDLLPVNYPNVRSMVKVREKLEKGANTAIVFESENPSKTLNFLKETVIQLKNHPAVGRVIDKKIGFDFFNRNKLMYVDLKDLVSIRDEIGRRIQKEKLGPLYIDLEDSPNKGDAPKGESFFQTLEGRYKDRYSVDGWSEYNVSTDGKIFSIQVGSKSEDNSLAEASRFHDAMEAFVKNLHPEKYEPTLKVYFAGTGKVLEYRALMRDLTKIGIISGILLFIPLFFRFRNPIHLGLIFIPLILGMPISFAAASFFIPRLNVSTSFLFAILGGLGVENGIHIFSRYFEVRHGGETLSQALQDIFE
ncbi:MAG: MMPL family transporter, partial [Deltaproteobacteria bacterium]|nr:MMPL family transporter [Deltaproteobacteria bacterium]